jgi:hypothetical protein
MLLGLLSRVNEACTALKKTRSSWRRFRRLEEAAVVLEKMTVPWGR